MEAENKLWAGHTRGGKMSEIKMKAVARRIRILTVERENLMISGLDQGIRWVKKINSKRILNALRKMINHKAAQVVYQVVSRVRMTTLTTLEIKSNL